MSHTPWQTLESVLTHHTKPVYEGQIVRLGIESLTLPNGLPLELEIIRHPGGAAVVASDDQQRICLLRQYRHAAGGWLWELPAGKLDAGEAPQATAERELEEEAGLRAGRWEKLGAAFTTPGFCDELIHLYLATELNHIPAQPEAHELIEIHWLALETALEQVHEGIIHDAKSMLGLLLAADRLRAPAR